MVNVRYAGILRDTNIYKCHTLSEDQKWTGDNFGGATGKFGRGRNLGLGGFRSPGVQASDFAAVVIG